MKTASSSSPNLSTLKHLSILNQFSSTSLFSLNSQADLLTATEFDFGTLTLASLKLLGDAHINIGSVRLTHDVTVPYAGAGKGKVLYSKPVRFRQPGSHTSASFSTFFSFSITNLNQSSIGAWLAFVITPNDEAVGSASGSLGLLDEQGAELGFVAVGFDTLMDVEFSDIHRNLRNLLRRSQLFDFGSC